LISTWPQQSLDLAPVIDYTLIVHRGTANRNAPGLGFGLIKGVQSSISTTDVSISEIAVIACAIAAKENFGKKSIPNPHNGVGRNRPYQLP
jgi:hypothetical protein